MPRRPRRQPEPDRRRSLRRLHQRRPSAKQPRSRPQVIPSAQLGLDDAAAAEPTPDGHAIRSCTSARMLPPKRGNGKACGLLRRSAPAQTSGTHLHQGCDGPLRPRPRVPQAAARPREAAGGSGRWAQTASGQHRESVPCPGRRSGDADRCRRSPARIVMAPRRGWSPAFRCGEGMPGGGQEGVADDGLGWHWFAKELTVNAFPVA